MLVKYLKVSIVVFILFPFTYARSLNIIQIQSQTDIQIYLKPGTWIFTDLDRTLVAKNQGTPHAYELNPAYTKLLKDLIAQGYPVFGLTARRAEQFNYTKKHLDVLGLDFSKSLKNAGITEQDAPLFKAKNTTFKAGVLFSPKQKKSKKTKGLTLQAFLDAFPKDNRTVLVIDDQKKQLMTIAKDVQAEGTLAYFPFQGHFLFEKQVNPIDFPSSFERLKAVEVISHWGRKMLRLKESTSGLTYLLQSHPNNDVMKEEILALKLYEAFGLAVPDYAIINGRGIEMNLKGFPCSGNNFFILIEDFLKTESPYSETPIEDHLRTHFVLDAFLSHCGLIREQAIHQVSLQSNGLVYRPDMFATLRSGFGGKHKKRQPNWTLDKVIELDWFRDSSQNPQGALLFSSLSNNELKAQIDTLLAKEELILSTFETTQKILVMNNSDELRLMLKSRLNDLRERLTKL